ncbi:hypothetical protein AALO_G00039780 [Alosa alosa]|uniref:CSN8/PSMD8/EIF3K domain-containing protein n=1 Tax=Alosa alosa TaxID=278164 RepID=A0AAV6HB46_9TELE|nr:hypothetical protein AALO_G00039780 [Alosa alosa]
MKMPSAVMMSENFDKLLEQCETQELEAPGGIATPQVYSQLLALYLLHNDMNNGRYLWKRIPQAIKTANPELAAAWTVGQHIWQRDFPGIYTAIAAFQWSESIGPIMEALQGTRGVSCLPVLGLCWESLWSVPSGVWWLNEEEW